MCRVAWDLPAPAVSPEPSDTIARTGLWSQLRLDSWLRVGLWALLTTLAPSERSENAKRAGLWVHLEPRDLSTMLPPECLENVERMGLWVGLLALCSIMLPPECSENVERTGMWLCRGLLAPLSAMLHQE